MNKEVWAYVNLQSDTDIICKVNEDYFIDKAGKYGEFKWVKIPVEEVISLLFDTTN